MDFGNAVLLIATVVGLVSLARSLKDGTTSDRINVGIVIAVAFLAVFLLGATSWASTQIINGVEMDNMSVADKILIAIWAAGAASFGWETLKSVRNIGENQNKEA